MVYKNLDDINFFERSSQERENIETICKNCQEFTVDPYPTCKSSNQPLIFSQLKKFQKCPKELW